MNEAHSQYCHCACPLLAERVLKVIETMKSYKGSTLIFISMLENALDDHDL
jgi:hypothetical protein